MKSRVAREFWRLFYDLPPEIQRLAYKNYLLWQSEPRHPSLRFKPIGSGRWSARIGEHYRAVGRFVESDTFVWTWRGDAWGRLWNNRRNKYARSVTR